MREHAACALGIGTDRGARNTVEIIVAERNERIGDKARARHLRIVVGVAVGELPEVFEGAHVVARHAVAFGIHAAELPEREAVAVLGGVLQRGDRAVLLAGAQRLGAGEILLTSMDRDGTKVGFDLPLTRAVSDAVGVPVIASGGVGNLQHLADGITEGRADAVLAASIFHYGEHTVGEAKRFMAQQGIAVRL